MKFLSEQDRLNHPVAWNIPEDMWRAYFHCELDDTCLNIMQQPSVNAALALVRNNLNKFSSYHDERMLLVLCYAFPDLSDEHIDCLPLRAQLCLNVLTNQLESLRQLYPVLEEDAYFHIFCYACSFGNIYVLEWLTSILGRKNISALVTQSNGEALKCAARGGQTNVFEYLEDEQDQIVGSRLAVYAIETDVLNTIVRHDQFDFFRYLQAKTSVDYLNSIIKAKIYDFISEAVSVKSLQFLDYFAHQISADEFKDIIRADNYQLCIDAINYDDVKILEYLISILAEDRPMLISANNYAVLREVIRGENPLMFKYCIDNFSSALKNINNNSDSTIIYGLLKEVLKLKCSIHNQGVINYWLNNINLKQSRSMFCANDYELFRLSVKHGYLHLVQYCRQNFSKDFEAMLQTKSYEAFRSAVEYGYIHIVDFILDQAKNLIEPMISSNDFYVVKASLLCKTDDMFRYLLNYTIFSDYVAKNITKLDSKNLRLYIGFSASENLYLKMMKKCFNTVLIGFSFDQIYQLIYDDVVDRYNKKPAYFTLASGDKQILPLSKDEFDHLSLNIFDKYKALQVYYEHDMHTAYRYLSRPNEWVNTDSPIFMSNDIVTEDMYQAQRNLLVFLFLAKINNPLQSILRFFSEPAIELFYTQIVFLHRNFAEDMCSSAFSIILDTSDFDCFDSPKVNSFLAFLNMMRHTLQLVKSHNVIPMLTKLQLERDIETFCLAYWQDLIKSDLYDHRLKIKEICKKYKLNMQLANDDWQCIKKLDLPLEQQYKLVDLLADRYDVQFTKSKTFLEIVDKFLRQNKEQEAHFLYSGIKFNLESLFDNKNFVARTSFFADFNGLEPFNNICSCCSVM